MSDCCVFGSIFVWTLSFCFSSKSLNCYNRYDCFSIAIDKRRWRSSSGIKEFSGICSFVIASCRNSKPLTSRKNYFRRSARILGSKWNSFCLRIMVIKTCREGNVDDLDDCRVDGSSEQNTEKNSKIHHVFLRHATEASIIICNDIEFLCIAENVEY